MDYPLEQQIPDIFRIHPELKPFLDACNGRIRVADFAMEINRQLHIHMNQTILSRKGIVYGQDSLVMDPLHRLVVQADILVERGLYRFALEICCSVLKHVEHLASESFLEDEPWNLVGELGETLREMGVKADVSEKAALFERLQILIKTIEHGDVFYNSMIGMVSNLIGTREQEDWIVQEFDRAYETGMTEAELVDIVIPMVHWLRYNKRHEEADIWVETYKGAWLVRELKIRELMEDRQWDIAMEECEEGITEGKTNRSGSAVMRMSELKRQIALLQKVSRN